MVQSGYQCGGLSMSIPDSPEDAPQIDHFGQHRQESTTKAPAKAFHAGIVPCNGEEVMEESLPNGENVGSDSSEELDSDEGTPRCHCSDSISQAKEEGEDGEELAEEPAQELAEEPTEELAAGPTEETAVERPTEGQESPLRNVRETEEREVIHTSEEEIDCLC